MSDKYYCPTCNSEVDANHSFDHQTFIIRKPAKKPTETSELNALRAENTRLKAELELAKQDSERLDEVQRQCYCVSFNTRYATWVVQAVDQVVGSVGKGATLRQAIDAARNKGEK